MVILHAAIAEYVQKCYENGCRDLFPQRIGPSSQEGGSMFYKVEKFSSFWWRPDFLPPMS